MLALRASRGSGGGGRVSARSHEARGGEAGHAHGRLEELMELVVALDELEDERDEEHLLELDRRLRVGRAGDDGQSRRDGAADDDEVVQVPAVLHEGTAEADEAHEDVDEVGEREAEEDEVCRARGGRRQRCANERGTGKLETHCTRRLLARSSSPGSRAQSC